MSVRYFCDMCKQPCEHPRRPQRCTIKLDLCWLSNTRWTASGWRTTDSVLDLCVICSKKLAILLGLEGEGAENGR
jgi:hypothetical protein